MSELMDGFAVAAAPAGFVVASDGTLFDPRADTWDLPTRTCTSPIKFSSLREMATADLVQEVKRPFRLLAETRNLNSVRSSLQQFRSLLLVAHQRRDFLVDEIDAEDVAAWIGRGNLRYIGQLRPLTDAWRTLRLPGFSAEAFDLLLSMRAPSIDALEAVRTWDPDTGPYRPAEDAALKVALDDG